MATDAIEGARYHDATFDDYFVITDVREAQSDEDAETVVEMEYEVVGDGMTVAIDLEQFRTDETITFDTAPDE